MFFVNCTCNFTALKLKDLLLNTIDSFGDRGGTVVKVLCYRPEGRWFDPNWCQ